MKQNIQTQRIISLLPLIYNLRESGHTFTKITTLLKSMCDLNIEYSKPHILLANIIRQEKEGKLNHQFANYKLFFYYHHDSPTYLERSVKTEYGFNFTFKNVGILDNRLITHENFHLITDIRGILIAKRLLRLHTITDSKLITNFLKNDKCKITNEIQDFINNIHQNIIPIFNNLDDMLNSKPLLFNNYNWDE